MRVVFLSAYPVAELEGDIEICGNRDAEHSATWVPAIIKCLTNNTNIELHVITYSNLVAGDQYTQQDGVHYHILKLPLMRYRLASWFHLDQWKFTRKLKEIKPDLVHGHGTESVYSYIALRSGFPTIITIQGVLSHISKVTSNSSFVDRWVTKVLVRREELTLREGRFFIANTRFAEQLVRKYNNKASIHLIENPLHSAFYKNRNRDFASRNDILFVGSISKPKGIEELICAFAYLHRVRPDIRLKLIGYGDPSYITGKVLPLIEGLQLQQAVLLLGKKTSLEIVKELEIAMCLVLPSHAEQAPQVIAEAMAIGVPVIGSRVGGIPDMIEEGRTGLLCEPADEQDLKDKLEVVIDDRELRVQMGTRARECAQIRHSRYRIAQCYMKVYGEVISCY